MSDKDIYKECAATSTATLEEYITNPCIPKNENEWWASREIERLRAENEKLREALKPFKEIHDKCLAAFPDIEDADELHFSVADFAHLRAAAAAIRDTE